MKGFAKIFFWVHCVLIASEIVSENYEKNSNETSPFLKQSPSIFMIHDGKRFFLNETYCLKSIMVRAYMTNDTYDGESAPSMRLDIIWESSEGVNSLNVESNSQHDPYCASKDRFSYNRKPIKQNMHTFPDIVNYGSRYIPVKLDCKYTIVPEMSHPCAPVQLKYSSPVCLAENVCSCRNTSLPAPNVKLGTRSEGVHVYWEIKDQGSAVNISIIKKVCISLEMSQENVPFNMLMSKPEEFSTDIWSDPVKRSGNHFFRLNSTIRNFYTVKVFYENFFECPGNITELSFHFPGTSEQKNYVILYLSCYAFALLLLIGTIFYFVRRKYSRLICNKLFFTENERRTQIADNSENVYPLQGFDGLISVSNPSYTSEFRNDLYIIDYGKLMFKRKLNEGNFGIVHLAFSSKKIKGFKKFAVKQLKSTATSEDIKDFLEEMETFKKAGRHPNIVRMIGYCKAPQPLSIVMEYVPYNLLGYLRSLRDEFDTKKLVGRNCSLKIRARSNWGDSNESLPSNYVPACEIESVPLDDEIECAELEYVLDNRELESFALQIARGMEHLEKKNIVHRDLAARNILVDNYKNLKISDFGMSKMGIYVNKTNRKFPLRWMSPEAINERIFSNKSDVWSYGIVLWEIGTLGGFPYSELENDKVLTLLKEGGHLDQPESVTSPLYNLMLCCWASTPEKRPCFSQIVKEIENLRQKAYVDFTDLRHDYILPPMEEELDKC